MALPQPGNHAYGPNPRDPKGKPSRPAIVLRARPGPIEPMLTVIFGQSHNTGTGPALHIPVEDRRVGIHGWFFLSSIQELPLSHFPAGVVASLLPRDIWREMKALLEAGPDLGGKG